MYLGRGWASVDGKREAVTSASAIAVRGDDGVPFHNLYLILIVAVLATVPMDIIPVLAIAIVNKSVQPSQPITSERGDAFSTGASSSSSGVSGSSTAYLQPEVPPVVVQRKYAHIAYIPIPLQTFI